MPYCTKLHTLVVTATKMAMRVSLVGYIYSGEKGCARKRQSTRSSCMLEKVDDWKAFVIIITQFNNVNNVVPRGEIKVHHVVRVRSRCAE